MPVAKLHVPDLRERSREATLTAAVRALDGVFAATASHTARCLEVDFDDGRVTLAEIGDAAAAAGFTTEVRG